MAKLAITSYLLNQVTSALLFQNICKMQKKVLFFTKNTTSENNDHRFLNNMGCTKSSSAAHVCFVKCAVSFIHVKRIEAIFAIGKFTSANAMNRRLVQGVTLPSLQDSWDRRSHLLVQDALKMDKCGNISKCKDCL